MNKKDSSEKGTYVAARVTRESREEIIKFCEENGINLGHMQSKYDRRMHATVFFSDYQSEQSLLLISQPIQAYVESWEILKTATGLDCLVLKLQSPDLEKIHSEIRDKYKISHNYKNYTPHISLDYEFQKDLSIQNFKIPPFPINFFDLYLKELY